MGSESSDNLVFEDALEEQEDKVAAMAASKKKTFRKPVTLHKDESGQQFFYLKQDSFPKHNIAALNIRYSAQEKDQVKKQVHANQCCPEIILKNVPVECVLKGKSASGDEFLNETSFRLSKSKIAAIRMRMYSKQKMDAQLQLEQAKRVVTIHCDIECRLMSNEEKQ